MYGNKFYHEITRKLVATFGTHFNNIQIDRKDNSGSVIQSMTVPIHYAPVQKFLAKMSQDKDLTAPAITLPRMSFEITDISYNSEKRLSGATKKTYTIPDNDNSKTYSLVPAPYKIEFQLNIMAKYREDGTKIVEQILPYFTPSVIPSVKMLDGIDEYFDIPITLNSVSIEDTYESDFQSRRMIIWTLNFTMDAFYFGPTSTKKVIKFADVRLYGEMDATQKIESVTAQPGLTVNGEPTTNSNNSISYLDINEDDDWAYIVKIEEA